MNNAIAACTSFSRAPSSGRPRGRLGGISVGPLTARSGTPKVYTDYQSVYAAPNERQTMQTYVILRRNGWATPADLEQAAARSTAQGDAMPDDIRWIRSYVLGEDDGSVGTVCIYEASSPEAIHRHAAAADLPVDEIIVVADTVLVRPDPTPATA
jgi:Protein of unknown function (DUF4242)